LRAPAAPADHVLRRRRVGCRGRALFRDVNRARQAVTHTGYAMSRKHIRSGFFAAMVLTDPHPHAGEPEEACRVALGALDLANS
jgi:hypothetical protein